MRLLILVFFVLLTFTGYGQSGYSLDFKIKGWKDTTVFLANFYGESNQLRDTAKVNGKGEFSFEGKKALSQGVYFLVLKNSRIFDFVIGDQQHFSMASDTADLIKNMRVTGDPDNKMFFDILRFNVEKHKEAEPFLKVLQDTTLKDEAKRKPSHEAFNKITADVNANQNEAISKYPKSVTARIFNATKPVEVPDPPKRPDGRIDSSFQLKYYRQHFFDNFDLADDALLRMPKPVYQEKVKEYLSKLFLPQSDTITQAINGIVAKAKTNPETYKYIVYTCLFLYQQPDIMGLDQVFVNIYKKYFETGEMNYWANDQLKKNLKEHAAKISQAQIGAVAPNLIMQDQNLQPKSLYDIKKKYAIIYFFDPDCGHCRQESPKLVDFYNKNKVKFDFEVFAVASDTSMKKLRDYIKEMKMTWITVDGPRSYLGEHYNKLYFVETYPAVYILDNKKKVIARKLSVEKIGDFLTNYEKFQKQKQSVATGKGTQ
jgi:peroxiredoxin